MYRVSIAAATFAVALNPSTGVIVLSLDAPTTSNIYPRRYVYDTIISFPGAPGGANTVVRVLEGVVDVSPRVTR